MDIEGFVRKRIDDYTYEDLTALLACLLYTSPSPRDTR